MKQTMKIAAVVVMALVLMTSVYAKENKRVEMAKRGYAEALQKDVAGLRNSALLQIIKLKSTYTDCNISELCRLVKKMGQNDPRFILRTNAQMTTTILENPHLMNLVNPYDFVDPNVYFDTFYMKLAESQVAMQ